MKIGVLTYYRLGNFGANLQAVSTYCYLKKNGCEPVFIDYTSYQTEFTCFISNIKKCVSKRTPHPQQIKHIEFIDNIITSQIHNLHTCSQIKKAILHNNINGVIIGSDAVVQHWPLFSTLRLGKHRPYWIEPLPHERRFPNPFWGYGFSDIVPTAMMSVSSQNSKYNKFSRRTLYRMATALRKLKYISTRDKWTMNMMLTACPELTIDVTPDPVFAINQNLAEIVPDESYIRRRFNLPKHYVLVGLKSQVLNMAQLKRLNELFMQDGKECVAFCIEDNYAYSHPFSYQIQFPINPIEWYALIKYASAYIGSNMHPIVSSLANAVPCFSLDNWGSTNFWGKKREKRSSKVYDILEIFGLTKNHSSIENGHCEVSIEEIINRLQEFPTQKVEIISKRLLDSYNKMMQTILERLQIKKI